MASPDSDFELFDLGFGCCGTLGFAPNAARRIFTHTIIRLLLFVVVGPSTAKNINNS